MEMRLECEIHEKTQVRLSADGLAGPEIEFFHFTSTELRLELKSFRKKKKKKNLKVNKIFPRNDKQLASF